MPVCAHQHDFKNFWIYGAVSPHTGASHFMEFPTLDGMTFQEFLDDFARNHPDTLNMLLLDNAKSHQRKGLRIPENVVLFLAAVCAGGQPLRAGIESPIFSASFCWA